LAKTRQTGYQIKLKETELSKEWVCEKRYSGGSTFFRGPHEISTNLISSQYKGDIEKTRITYDQFEGIPLDMGDAAYVFNITPRIPVVVRYWGGDGEFAPESKILYDKSITEHMAMVSVIFYIFVY
jgi:hypothetical protein